MEELTDWASDKPFFTLEDLEKKFNYYRNYSKIRLHKRIDKGEVKEIEQGKYTVHDDLIIPASHLEENSFLSFDTALEYYNLIEKESDDIHVITEKDRKDIGKIKFHSCDKAFGFCKREYKGFEIFIADKERLLIDCLRKGEVSTEVLEKLVEEVNREKVIKYCEKFGDGDLKEEVKELLNSGPE